MKTVVAIQARMTSTRLPGKVLLPLAGAPLLQRVVERAERIAGVDQICIALPFGVDHDPIAAWAQDWPTLSLVRGPEDDVLARFGEVAAQTGADEIVRITADCPLLEPRVAEAVMALRRSCRAPLAATALESGYPTGMDVEVFTRTALEAALLGAHDPYEREHVTAFLWRRPEEFPAVYLDRKPDRRSLRLAVDTREDYALVSQLYAALHRDGECFGLAEIEAYLASHPEMAAINRGVEQHPYQFAPHVG